MNISQKIWTCCRRLRCWEWLWFRTGARTFNGINEPLNVPKTTENPTCTLWELNDLLASENGNGNSSITSDKIVMLDSFCMFRGYWNSVRRLTKQQKHSCRFSDSQNQLTSDVHFFKIGFKYQTRKDVDL